MTTIDRQFLRDRPCCRDLLEQTLPDVALGPAIVAIINGGGRAIGRRNIAPTAPRLQHMQDARDHDAVIDPRFARLAVRKMRLNRIPCLVRKPK